VYSTFAERGTAPTRAEVDEVTDGRSAEILSDLHDRHALVLGTDGDIRMALPFSAGPTVHRVTSGKRSWWANCAWDALAIPLMLGVDAGIESVWADTGAVTRFEVRNGDLVDDAGTVHYSIPARRWWNDIVET